MPTTHFINGQWIEGQGASIASTDPAKNHVFWQGNAASAEQVNDAVNAARTALPAWSALTVEARLAIIKQYGELLAANKPELAALIAQETGKPLWETATEVAAMIEQEKASA